MTALRRADGLLEFVTSGGRQNGVSIRQRLYTGQERTLSPIE
jgi:hypothetical protein